MRSVIKEALRLQCKSSKSNLSFFFASFSSSSRLAVEKGSKDFGEELEGYTVIEEGEAKILMTSSNTVFYNRAQVNNRDLSIAVLRTFISKRKEEHFEMLNKKVKLEKRAPEETPFASVVQKSTITQEKVNHSTEEPEEILKETQKTTSWKGMGKLEPPRILEALAASGLRSIRYALEIDEIGQVVALDRDKESVEACMKNIQFNGSVACSKVEAHLADAQVYMLTHPKEFEAVDLDPYGSPSVFLDSAVQSIIDGGMLMCSATDLAVLCGRGGDVCYSKYGSYPLKGKYCHEMALRILLACIEELPDVPLFVNLHNLCSTLKCTTPPAVMFCSAVTNAGYRISGSHTTPLGFKTDAPMSVIWDIMRCWVKRHPVKAQQPGQSGSMILSKEPTLQANFSQGAVSRSKTQAKRGVRFLPNPEKYWGPNIKAGRQITSKHGTHLFPQRIVCHEEENAASQSLIKQET